MLTLCSYNSRRFSELTYSKMHVYYIGIWASLHKHRVSQRCNYDKSRRQNDATTIFRYFFATWFQNLRNRRLVRFSRLRCSPSSKEMSRCPRSQSRMGRSPHSQNPEIFFHKTWFLALSTFNGRTFSITGILTQRGSNVNCL